MADISAQIRAIQEASRGEEVRDAIVEAIIAINNGESITTDTVNELISDAIKNLDVSSSGGDGKYIKSISETDGKISANEETMDTQPVQNSKKAITSGGVFSLSQTLQQNFQAGVDSIYDAVVAKGSTPASKSLSDVVAGIGAIETGITPTGTKQITQNGVSDVTNYASVNVQVPTSGGITPVMTMFLDGGDGAGLALIRNKTISGLRMPDSDWIEDFNAYAYHDAKSYSGYRNSDTPTPTSFDLTEAILLEDSATFKARFSVATSMEYYGNIYNNTTLIDLLGLVLLGDSSQDSPSTLTLNDSIDNYDAILLQGIYQIQRTSNYNTTKVYISPLLNTQYWAGMKDRNSNYDCYVTFTSNTEVSLTGNKQVLIYGIPKLQ